MRSGSALIQTIEGVARNANGRVILYADKETDSMKYAIGETRRRREIQSKFNKDNNITPATVKKKINDILMFTDKRGQNDNEDSGSQRIGASD